MKLTKRTGTIAIVLVALIAFMGFGFAAFSSTLKASGTIGGVDVKWDVHFKSVTLKAVEKAVVGGETPVEVNAAAGTITDGGKSLTFDNVCFNEPSGYAMFTVTVENLGTMDAVLNEITPVNTAGSGKVIVTLPETFVVNHATSPNGGTCTFDVLVQAGDIEQFPTCSDFVNDAKGDIGLTLKYVTATESVVIPSTVHYDA